MHVQKDSVVSIHYTLTIENGETVQSSQGDKPVDYLHGYGNIVTGLEEALEGATIGANIEVSVTPDKGYGWFSMDWVKKVPKSSFPGVDNIEVGMAFNAETEDGPRQFIVTSVNGDEVEVNGNHPLAGETLRYSVSVAGLRKSTQAERQQGHIQIESKCQKTGCCD